MAQRPKSRSAALVGGRSEASRERREGMGGIPSPRLRVLLCVLVLVCWARGGKGGQDEKQQPVRRAAPAHISARQPGGPRRLVHVRRRRVASITGPPDGGGPNRMMQVRCGTVGTWSVTLLGWLAWARRTVGVLYSSIPWRLKRLPCLTCGPGEREGWCWCLRSGSSSRDGSIRAARGVVCLSLSLGFGWSQTGHPPGARPRHLGSTQRAPLLVRRFFFSDHGTAPWWVRRCSGRGRDRSNQSAQTQSSVLLPGILTGDLPVPPRDTGFYRPVACTCVCTRISRVAKRVFCVLSVWQDQTFF